MKKIAITSLLFLSSPLLAEDFDTKFSANLEAFYSGYDVALDSPFNPNNDVAQIPDYETQVMARMDFTATSDYLAIQVKPRLGQKWIVTDDNSHDDQEHYLQEGKLQVFWGDSSVAIKRQFMTWGASQFASPSNPFFKSNNASNPFVEPPARDFVEYAYDISDSLSTQVIYNYNEGRDTVNYPEFEPISVVKLDYVAEKFNVSFLAGERDGDAHLGAYGQYTLTDAMLAYLDVGYRHYSFTQVAQFDAANNYWANAPRESVDDDVGDVLVGASYTFLNGTTLNLEYRYNSEGFSEQENENFYTGANIAEADFLQGNNLNLAIPYFSSSFDNFSRTQNKNYVHLQYFARDVITDLGITLLVEHGLDDSSTKIHLIANYYINDHFRFSTNAIYNAGGVDGEYGRYMDNLIFTGIKYYF